MSGKRQLKRLCCSKKTLVTSWAVFITLLLCLLYGLFFTDKDMTPLVTVLCFDGGVTGAATGFYYWKAKAEKKLELFERMAEKWEKKYGIEAVTALAQTILND